MTVTQKIIAAALIAAFWLGAIVCKHLFPDIDTSAFVAACATMLGGLGIHSAYTATRPGDDAPAAPGGKEGGFARLGMLGFTIMFFVPLVLWGCANMTPTQVGQVKLACATDAGIRPTVDVLLAIPGLARPEEALAVTAARTIIDQVCKDPEHPTVADPYAMVTQATSTVTTVLLQLEQRKQAGK